MATSSGCDYEVFLSFKGPDTGRDFTDFLYTFLIHMGIRVFRDNEELRIGEEIGSQVLHAINRSKISIPIFSKGYASSVCCLKELVQMLKCQKAGGQKIMPVYYDVSPSVVRCQIGDYEEAFLALKKRYDEETMLEWKDALGAVANLKGWDLREMPNRGEGHFAKEIAEQVFDHLRTPYLAVPDYLVSVDHHVDEIMKMIGDETSETRIIGIHGMGGVGKTTIAKIIYNLLSNAFKDCCFLSNIREVSKCNGVVFLQEQLIRDILKTTGLSIRDVDDGIQIIKERLSNKRVLLLLDDVDGRDQMYPLVGRGDWLGEESKIIINTRNKQVLLQAGIYYHYEVNGMDPDQSLQLFSRHAFRRDYPLDEYIDQSKKAIDIAGGLPLALEVIGSRLSCCKGKEWDVILKKLEVFPDPHVRSKLKISFDALHDRDKHIFLDVACLFVGYDKGILVYFWSESRLFPQIGMQILRGMSLIKIKECNEVWMHNQLRVLGREIVREESGMKIEKQSRVWNPEEALELLASRKGEKKVEALRLKFDHQHQYCVTYEDLTTLSNLKFLEIDSSKENFLARGRLLWHESQSVFQQNSDLLPELQWLSWHDIPPIFNITNFSMKKVIILDLSRSEITHDWNGWSHLKVTKNLKVLNLTGCCSLERTPNFSSHARLERLILRGCSKLIEIDRSICNLKQLVSLDVRYCRRLRRLPEKLGRVADLHELLIDCTLIEEIPNCQGMWYLRIVTASRCPIITLPHSTGDLAALQCLTLADCWSLKKLPDSIGNLESLIELDISGTRIEQLPDSIGNLINLKVVKMMGSSMSKIPDALWSMEKLEEIEAADNRHMHVEVGNGIYISPSVRFLKLRHADIYAVSRLPESLVRLYLSELWVNTFPDLSNLINLKELHLCFAAHASVVKSCELVDHSMPQWIGKLSKLETLNLTSPYVTTLPTDVSCLHQLKALDLVCFNMRCLPRLPPSLLSLRISFCKSLCSMDISNLKKLSSLAISSSAISEIQGLDCLENLQDLELSGLGQVETLPDLSNVNKLRSLKVRCCGNLVEIRGELPQSLKELDIRCCGSLAKLPDLSILKGLQKVGTSDCTKLDVEALLSFALRCPANFWE